MLIRNAYRGKKQRPVIYDLRYATLSGLLNVSHTSLRKHVKAMVSLGWAKWIGKDLVLTGLNRLKKNDRDLIYVPVHKTKALQIQEFRKIILFNNLNNQQKQLAVKGEAIKKCDRGLKLTHAEYKLLQRAKSVEALRNSHIDCVTLSNKGIGRLFTKRRSGAVLTLSKYGGGNLQKKFREAKIIKSKVRLKFVKACSLLEYNYLYRGTMYVFNFTTNRLYQRLSNEILPLTH